MAENEIFTSLANSVFIAIENSNNKYEEFGLWRNCKSEWVYRTFVYYLLFCFLYYVKGYKAKARSTATRATKYEIIGFSIFPGALTNSLRCSKMVNQITPKSKLHLDKKLYETYKDF